MSGREPSFGNPYRSPAETDPQVLKERVERDMQEVLAALFEGKTCSEIQSAFSNISGRGWEISQVYVSPWLSQEGEHMETCGLRLKEPKVEADVTKSMNVKADPDHEPDVDLRKLNFLKVFEFLGWSTLEQELSKSQHRLAFGDNFLRKRSGWKQIDAKIKELDSDLDKARELVVDYEEFVKRYDALRLLNRCLRKVAGQDPAQKSVVEDAEKQAWAYLRDNSVSFLSRVEEIERKAGVAIDEEEKMKLKRYVEQS